jgi:hypothetical protein
MAESGLLLSLGLILGLGGCAVMGVIAFAVAWVIVNPVRLR